MPIAAGLGAGAGPRLSIMLQPSALRDLPPSVGMFPSDPSEPADSWVRVIVGGAPCASQLLDPVRLRIECEPPVGAGFAQAAVQLLRADPNAVANDSRGWLHVDANGGVWTNSTPVTELMRPEGISGGRDQDTTAPCLIPSPRAAICAPLGPLPKLLPQQGSTSVVAGPLRQSGGAALILRGSGWTDVTGSGGWEPSWRMLVGPHWCSGAASSLDLSPGSGGTDGFAQLRCTSLPAGSGGPHPVGVLLAGGVRVWARSSLEAGGTLLPAEYERAAVLGLEPAFVELSASSNETLSLVRCLARVPWTSSRCGSEALRVQGSSGCPPHDCDARTSQGEVLIHETWKSICGPLCRDHCRRWHKGAAGC